jgi:hypothetical protein
MSSSSGDTMSSSSGDTILPPKPPAQPAKKASLPAATLSPAQPPSSYQWAPDATPQWSSGDTILNSKRLLSMVSPELPRIPESFVFSSYNHHAALGLKMTSDKVVLTLPNKKSRPFGRLFLCDVRILQNVISILSYLHLLLSHRAGKAFFRRSVYPVRGSQPG